VTVNFATYTLTNVQLPYLAGVAGSNYGATNGQLTFPPGVSSASFTVPVYQQRNKPGRPHCWLELFSRQPDQYCRPISKNSGLDHPRPPVASQLGRFGGYYHPEWQGFNNGQFLWMQPDASILAAASSPPSTLSIRLRGPHAAVGLFSTPVSCSV
jgi:hypothetical protein